MAINSPEVPERYLLSELVGEGGMGQVWAGRDLVLDVPVAVKVIRPHIAERPDFRVRFSTEIAIQARFQHPNLVPIHDAGQLADGCPFVAMAFADRGSLARLLPGGLPWSGALSLIDEVLSALSVLHARGVIHRDLKPENILLHLGLDQRAHVWIGDLGIARLIEGPQALWGRTAGTPKYMAPEQFLGIEGELGRETDLFAVGRLLMLLVGGHPVPEGTEELILGMLNPSRHQRPSLAAEVRLALASLGEPTRPLRPLPVLNRGKGSSTWNTLVGDSRSEPTTTLIEVQREDISPWESQSWPSWPRREPPSPPVLAPRQPLGFHNARASLSIYALREVAIVGRESEIDALWSLARGVWTSGRPGVALIMGEAGSGRTKLVETLLQTLEEGGWAESLLVSYQEPPGPSDGLVGAMGRLLKPNTERPETTRQRMIRWFERNLPGMPVEPMAALATRTLHAGPGERDPERRSFAAQLVHWVLHARCWRGLSCLLIEDADRAKQPGEGLEIAIQLLNQASMGQPAPVLILCTVCTEALAGDLEQRQRLATLERMGALRIDLPRLTIGETRSLLDRSLDLAPDLRDSIAARCEGNPLLARQIVNCLAERDLLVEVQDLAYTLRPGVDPASVLPEDARTFFLERAERAVRSTRDPVGSRIALAVLALAGADIPESFLYGIAPELGPVLEAHGLMRRAEGRCLFSHQILHDVLRDSARARPDRRQLYRMVAEAWDWVESHTGEDVSVARAEALLEAGESALAFEPLARVAIQEQEAGLSRLALAHGSAAVRALEEVGGAEVPALASRLLSATARANLDLPRLERAEVLAWRALWTARNQEDRSYAALTLGEIALRQGSWPAINRLLTEMVREMREAGLYELLSETLGLIATASLRLSENDLAQSTFDEAISVERNLDRPLSLSRHLRGLALARLRVGLPESAVEAADEALFCLQGELGGWSRTLSLWTLGRLHRSLDRVDRGDQYLESAYLEFLGANAPAWSPVTALVRADLHRLRGEHTEARRLLHVLVQWCENNRLPYEQIDALEMLLLLELDEANHGAVLEIAGRSLECIGHTPAPHHHLIVLLATALTCARTDQRGPCEESFNGARGLRCGLSGDGDLAMLLDLLARETLERGWTEIGEWARSGARRCWGLLGRTDRIRRIELIRVSHQDREGD